ncbi:MAG: hypothetical protein NTY38_33300 [Acidobacteria bacterium]|nr:hypothetical protein [Acidobacteriota bacterium]
MNRLTTMNRVSALVIALTALLTPVQAGIRRIDIVHLSPMDVGFTDHPSVTREMQKLYLDQAIGAAVRDKGFAWTAESLLAVADWWQQASPEGRSQLLQLVEAGRIAIGALPLNNTPFLDREQWRQMLHWIPEELWRSLRPSVAVQDDVNGFPRAGVLALLDRGVTRLFMGLNSDSGGPPMERPTAFWWKMPDSRRLFVYLGDSYPAGYSYFHTKDWRRGPVPRVADTAFRLPREGDFFRNDEASIREAHRICVGRIRRLEQRGYRHSTLVIPFSNQWRMDNDPPFPPISAFVAEWNRLKLEPELRLVTAATALSQLESEIGADIPEFSGEWPDWWANGTASAPREVAASRVAKRWLLALDSPVWGSVKAHPAALPEELRKDLCLFDEHTWGSSLSVARPDSLETIAQFNEKSRLALRSMALAEWLAGQRARTLLESAKPGLYVVNPAPLPYTGWLPVAASALRSEYPGIDHYERGMEPWAMPKRPADLAPEKDPAVFSCTVPKQVAKFWVENLAPNSVQPVHGAPPVTGAPSVATDAHGWPESVTWPGMARPLFAAGLADFTSIRPVGFAPRAILGDLAAGRPGKLETVNGTPLETTVEQTGHTLVYTQSFTHPSLRRARRSLEIWRSQPRARLTVTLYRNSSDAPESYYLAFPLPVDAAAPQLSVGGVPFVPYREQIPGTCMDYFAIDGWAHYRTTAGDWLWVSHDAPLVTFDKPEVWARRKTPAPTHRILSLLFSNFWYTNFVGNEHGAMEFTFDLVWSPKIAEPDGLARTLTTTPIVVQR